ncbi:MAG: response regulator transcription factor [Anaerolineae bacterium]|nr:response regulator transcription factor [Anaerolineae bacterium]
MKLKLLVVDDSLDTTLVLKRVLQQEGYEVEVAQNGAEGLRLAFDFRPDLILLDVMMPGMDGWTMLNRLREFTDVPVVMLTAVGGEESLVHGLDSGADDYLTKPFSMHELKARIRAVLRRSSLDARTEDRALRFDNGQLVIDPPSQQVTVRGEPVDLTPTEYRLLLCLAYNAGRVLNPDQILDHVWGPGYEDSVASVKLYVWYLRRKIEDDPGNPRYILTKRGAGYYMASLP